MYSYSGTVTIDANDFAHLAAQDAAVQKVADLLQREIDRSSQQGFATGESALVYVKPVAEALGIPLDYRAQKEAADGAGVQP